MKRMTALALCAILTLCLFTACTQKPEEPKTAQAQDEILTYIPVDAAKTNLFIGTSGSDFIASLNKEFERLNPDVQIHVVTMTGGSGSARPIADWVKNGHAPDILFVSEGYFTPEETTQYFENLSANPLVEKYQDEALNRLAINDNMYFLPGPSSITCMLYNNTLFEQYGWKVPKTFDEFVALCVQIREDTDGTIQPWNPNAKYETNFNAVTTAFVYDELFGGLDNRRWYEEFCDGKQTFAGHMEPYYDMLQTLVDNDILLEEHFSYSATARGNEFQAGQIAMYNYGVGTTRSDVYDIQYMPFPSTTGEEGFLVDNINTTVGVPKKEHTEEQQDAIRRYLEYFSTVEGQQVFIGPNLMFSNVKNVPLTNAEYLLGISEAISNGRYFSQLSFHSPTAKSNIIFTKDALAMVKGEKTGAQCIADIDAHPFKTEEETATQEAVATVADDFTILETSFFIADMYREKAGADVGLIAHNVVDKGNLMRLYKGDITADMVKSLKPRSFANKTTLIKVSMTGQQLLDAYMHITNYGGAADAIFAYSGLKCEVAPWKPMGEKYLSVTLTDGTAIDPAKTYTVAMWDGTLAAECFTEVLESYEGTWEEFMTGMLQAKGSIAPAKDGRIKLVWE